MPQQDLSEFFDGPQPCKVGRLRLEMDEEQLAKLEAAFARQDISHGRIADVVTKWGFPVSTNTILKHRKGNCGCP